VRLLLPVAALLALSCATGYQAGHQALGVEASELAGARRLYFGERAHVGMPHVTVDPKHASRAAARVKWELPDVEIASRVEEADFVISVLFNAKAVCSHCEVGPESEWVAVVERGGAVHRDEYTVVGPFLQLSGKVREGSSVTRAFVGQLKELLRPRTTEPPAN
jgi:hypothetical protein